MARVCARRSLMQSMEYREYIAGISFRFLQPRMKVPRVYHELARILGKAGLSAEFVNTVLPDDERGMKRRLREICQIQKMSTFAIGAMINRGVSHMPDSQVFVNVGVWRGFTFLSGMIGNHRKTCIGVDNFSEFGGPREEFLERFNQYKGPNHYFYEMDYVEYFANVHQEPIGYYVYDGHHSYNNQLQGLQAAQPFFSRNCIIMVDDTNWEPPRLATMDFIARSPYKYQIILDATTYCNFHPTLWNGVIVFQRI